jgi:hypothetical protein
MKSYNVVVQFDTTLNYRIRAKSDEDAAKELEKRVLKTMRRLDNPTILYIEVNGDATAENDIIELQNVCDH